ncbi:MAG TPA: hypothetical protein VL527_01080 [Dongiaceae bacterium]|nr:hypothetical protein [Dongiaceae bacterium]
MNANSQARPFVIALIAAVILYVVGFACIQYVRGKDGPWQVTFATENSQPTLTVTQPKLKVQGVKIIFTTTNAPALPPQNLKFDLAQPVPFDVPFGRCIFLDTISLPGTVTFQMFGHEIQLMPRVLTIDRVEHPWQSGQTLSLPATP